MGIIKRIDGFRRPPFSNEVVITATTPDTNAILSEISKLTRRFKPSKIRLIVHDIVIFTDAYIIYAHLEVR